MTTIEVICMVFTFGMLLFFSIKEAEEAKKNKKAEENKEDKDG